jgi:hypothetical protein
MFGVGYFLQHFFNQILTLKKQVENYDHKNLTEIWYPVLF